MPVERHRTADVGRRRFLGYVLAAPTLVAAAQAGELITAEEAVALPSLPTPAEILDLNDLISLAVAPTAHLITVAVHEDGTASLALPRTEVGQGITTSTAMLIAEELDLPLEKVRVTLADAQPELLFNQFTGGSTTTTSTYLPVRVAASIARGRLLKAAATVLGDTLANLRSHLGVITDSRGNTVGYGELAKRAAAVSSKSVETEIKAAGDFTMVGTPRNRVDAREAVTGRKTFAMDLDIPGALPAMICRPPTLNGSVRKVRNTAEVEAMPGITHVVQVSTGVAVRGRTFGQCIDAVRALEVEWGPGTVEGKSDATVERELQRAAVPPAVPSVPAAARSVDETFTFAFRSNSALEPNCAVADVRKDRAEIWGSLKLPVAAQTAIAELLHLPLSKVTVHVVQGGGSFGRKLFFDAALEAAEVSQKTGAPVKLMWHRTDDFRQGRTHPMALSRIRATYRGDEVLTFEQRHTSVATDFRHGLADIVTSHAGKIPGANATLAQSIFALTQEVPYDFGLVSQTLSETDNGFNTSSMRNIYSPDVRTAQELIVDRIADATGNDPYTFRRRILKRKRSVSVLDKVAEAGQWGRELPKGVAQGLAVHPEYKTAVAALVELDCRKETVERPVAGEAYAGPLVTKVVLAVDAGLAVNPRGLEAQMMGGAMDGIALALSSSLHLKDGRFLEGSWDNYFYTRQWNTPPELEIHVMPPSSDQPGGAGEQGVAATCAAVACAYARATGTMPKRFPINHGELHFEPLPAVPPVPASPTDGLDPTH